MPDDLIDRVARELYQRREGPVANADYKRQVALWDACISDARAVVALVLEEAADRLRIMGDMGGHAIIKDMGDKT